ncbi:hypothetical protein H0A71_12200 [Alcaligenaceae bacterium]|nr:hypothetical protein [Alcaligenaceae bacterium]
MNKNTNHNDQHANDLLDALRGLATADISDAMYSLSIPDSTLDPTVRLMVGETLLGRAVTVGRVPTPSNSSQKDLDDTMMLAVQEVIDAATPGSVLVNAVQGIASFANWGGNQALRASKVGMVGMVTDGAIRDLPEMAEYGVTIFAKGASPRAGQHFFSTVIKNGPVICAGVLIKPGDILVGDADGVIAIKPDDVTRIVEKVKDLKEKEQNMRTHILAGGGLVDAVLKYKVR